MEGQEYGLSEYLSRFRHDVRDHIYELIQKTKVVKDALQKPEGKIILEQPIEQYKNYILSIVDTLVAREGVSEEKLKTLIDAAQEARVRLEFILQLSGMVAEGQKHLKGIKKLNKEKTK
jgi:hypothetical protein